LIEILFQNDGTGRLSFEMFFAEVIEMIAIKELARKLP